MNRPREEFEAIARAFGLGDAVGARSGFGFLPQAPCLLRTMPSNIVSTDVWSNNKTRPGLCDSGC